MGGRERGNPSQGHSTRNLGSFSEFGEWAKSKLSKDVCYALCGPKHCCQSDRVAWSCLHCYPDETLGTAHACCEALVNVLLEEQMGKA